MEPPPEHNEANNVAAINVEVLSEIPIFQRQIRLESHGSSAWARSYRIDIIDGDEENERYFMKVGVPPATTNSGKDSGLELRRYSFEGVQVSVGDHGKEALKGEFQSTSAIHAIQDDFTPKPIAHGSFSKAPNMHYYLCKFYDLAEELPEPSEFCAKVAALHQKSTSPNGKYGFHIVTYNGNLPQENGYTSTWEECFLNGFKHMIDLNLERGGQWKEIESLKADMFCKVIPRLLRPLETGGRSIKPSLVHGDLWCGNTAVDTRTDMPLIYDPSSFYAHNEYELGNWRPERNKFSRSYFNAYHSHFPKSKPEEDYDDRNALYSVRFNLHAAAMFPHVTSFRMSVIDEMQRLVAKYPGGYGDYDSKLE